MRDAAAWFLAFALLVAGALTPSPGAAAPWLAVEPGLLKLAGRHVKWGQPSYGSGALVTYAYVTRPHVDPAARNCREMLPLDPMIEAMGIDMARFDLEIRAAFRVWSDAAAVRFRQVASMDEADILIGVQAGDRGVAFANVAEQESDGAIARISHSAVCFDASERWEMAADGRKDTYRLRYVAAHEIGHAVGLDHIGRKGGLMGFGYDGANEHSLTLSAADRAAIARLYGPPASAAIAATGEPGPSCILAATGPAPQGCGEAGPVQDGR
ncbi:matrixin family metalloprotease [Geminicoccaceae bacterium 1502E]|nr:matrixin family metalloprotease [Geminicoccaceae bacterium 1502E]